jgi:hypothetical protein
MAFTIWLAKKPVKFEPKMRDMNLVHDGCALTRSAVHER